MLRADAGPEVGIGHVMRCITMGGALTAPGARTVLLTAPLPDSLGEQARASGLTVAQTDPQQQDLASIEKHGPDFVMVDGYHLGGLVEGLTASPTRFGVIDDNNELPTGHADLVLNQNLHAAPTLYPDVPAERLLLGAPYALIRPDITAASRATNREPEGRIVVSLGGADPTQLTYPIAKLLLDSDDVDLRLAVGVANPRRDELIHLAETNPRAALDSGDLVGSLLWADIAVIGAGTTLWEVGHLGIPAVAVIAVDNQVQGGRAAAEAGFVDAVDLRDGGRAEDASAAAVRLLHDRARAQAMARRGAALFDGHGAERVAHRILTS